ncbi:hypothetical protein [Psychroserpens ponticola]|uniref:DUF4251 domain-containing protein n=1 Tax=Psychroserpens ponticola TaxID=2932268 RepID=A0ABY7RU05_9FLAO|nr:hypothetical protein [Psychroserpens ponticola]WCO00596.1 hypothetical protein MUN68_011020 [Psychroserpens ponticola]
MKKTILFFAMITMLFSCSGDDDAAEIANQFDGSLESVEEFFTPELVDALLDLGFIINTGDNPPNIEGVYFSSPFILEASTVPSDFVGQSFADYTSEFSNQDNGSLTIDFNGMGGNQTDVGFGSFVSGDGNAFSVYLKNTGTIGTYSADTAIAISGRMTEDGIEDFKLAALMLDDNGDPESVYIENNTGRLIYDSDEFSPRQ